MSELQIIARVHHTPLTLDRLQWNTLLSQQLHPTPFLSHEYLCALHTSHSAVPDTGWHPRFITMEKDGVLIAACPLYLKDHSYGEYVFDWAWARAYQDHGLAYYPKALIGVPFTPVPGTRLLARDAAARDALLQAVLVWCQEHELSSLHLLFGSEVDLATCTEAGLMPRTTVQFHWRNVAPTADTLEPPRDACHDQLQRYTSFDAFLAVLTQEKRKKIRQEQRRVADAGVTFRWSRGPDITPHDWAFFYRCYERTYLEHGNAPYLSPAFFERMAEDLPQAWLMFIAERGGSPIASSLIALGSSSAAAIESTKRLESASPETTLHAQSVAYGRYWGALERVDNLHFDACYYQPIRWCIEHGFDAFEGGAQGEHKMARALMPVATHSAHWLAHPAFADAVENFLAREGSGIDQYLEHLEARTPFRRTDHDAAATANPAK